MSINEMLEELVKIGFSIKLICKHTAISEHKIKHMRQGRYARFTYAEIEAFNHYYDKCKALQNVYGDKLAEYLEKETV